METLAAYAALNGADRGAVRDILECGTTDGAAAVLKKWGIEEAVYSQLAERAQVRSERYLFGKARVGVVFVTMEGKVAAVSSHASELIKEEKWHIN
jgi:cobalt-precorrin-5B (C1)-methyltransferase